MRGRVDHKERGETKLVVQEIEPFEPTPEEIAAAGAPPAELTARGAALRAVRDGSSRSSCGSMPGAATRSLIGDLKSVLEHFPGETEVLLEMDTSAGPRAPAFRRRTTASARRVALRAELDDLLGPDALVA